MILCSNDTQFTPINSYVNIFRRNNDESFFKYANVTKKLKENSEEEQVRIKLDRLARCKLLPSL